MFHFRGEAEHSPMFMAKWGGKKRLGRVLVDGAQDWGRGVKESSNRGRVTGPQTQSLPL